MEIITWDALFTGLSMLVDRPVLHASLMVVGIAFGCSLGAVPGFSGSLGMAVMLPVVFAMEPLTGLVFLLAIYTGGLFGGAISAVLLNTPGTPAALPTTFDGYPLAQKGQAGRALGVALGASASGGFLGSIVLLVLITPLAMIALRTGPVEMVMIAALALMLISTLASGSAWKAMFSGMLGIMIGTIGMTAGGVRRGGFGRTELLDGIPIIPALIGLFAISELLVLMGREYIKHVDDASDVGGVRQILGGIRESFNWPINIVRSGLIGVVIGALPAVGGAVGSLVSYSVAKQRSKNPDAFGHGSPEGIVGSEGANSSSEGGSLAIMLALGVPGSPATAILLGAIVMLGWTPGPRLFINHQEVLYGALLSQFAQVILLLPVGAAVAIALRRIVDVPVRLMVPIITVLCVVGAYSLRLRVFDVILVVVFGVVGYVFRVYGFSIIAMVLGLILGPILDAELGRTVQLYGTRGYANILVERPAATVMLVIFVCLVAYNLLKVFRNRDGRDRVDVRDGVGGE